MNIKGRIRSVYIRWYQRLRIRSAKVLSTNRNISGQPICNQPVYFMGAGKISFGTNVQLGFAPSPGFYDGSVYLETREKTAEICFGNDIVVNNNFRIICERTRVEIGDGALIGTHVEIIDSDFHGIHPNERCSGKHASAAVVIGKNVFIGSNARIMKGVTVGENSIIGNSAVVHEDVPPNTIVSGNPARIIKEIIT